MKQVTFHLTTLSVVESTDHVFLLSSKDVAKGYGVSDSVLRSHRQNQSDELIEGKHFIIDRSYKNTPKTMWTKRGIVRLGFFIKSEKAKAFRDWAEDYITVPHANTNELEELKKIILAQNAIIAQQPKQIKHAKTKLLPQDHNTFLDVTFMMIENIKELEEFSKHLEQRKESMTNFLNALCDRYEFVKKYRDKKM